MDQNTPESELSKTENIVQTHLKLEKNFETFLTPEIEKNDPSKLQNEQILDRKF